MTESVVIDVLRLALAALFAVAGAAKLADVAGAAQAARSFGAPQQLARPLATLLACVEIAIAAGLVITTSARAAAAAGAGLLIAFAAAVAVARLRGRAPDCHCFGRLHSAPAGWGLATRNLVLAALAVVVASRPAVAIGLPAALAGALIAQAALVVVLLRRYGRALVRIDELEADRQSERPSLVVAGEAPPFTLSLHEGGAMALGDLLRRGRAVLLVFVDADCGPCHALMPDVTRWSKELADRLTTVVVARGSSDEIDLLASHHADSLELVLQGNREVAELYGVKATPTAVLVGTDGRILRPPVAGVAAIADLVRTIESPSEDGSSKRSSGSRVATAASFAAGGALVAAAGSPASTGRASQDPRVADLQAIHDTLRAAGPRLMGATRRSSKAAAALPVLRPGPVRRKKQAAAAKALELERAEILRLSAALEKLQFTSRDAYNARASALIALSRFALSLQKRRRALTATPKAASALLADSDRLYQNGLDSVAASARILGSG